ncbi:acyltransferase [Nocardioides sp. URHA0020]|uniref:acyltransferase n=1 Tax=Nocardioides sp. URHA0020 TaxID=1380392 RepID=UPI0009DF4D74|nr:acyltransferase [Nocardioides sp. URHA0020]
MSAEDRVRGLPTLVRGPARAALRLVSLAYRVRYPRRLRLGRDVVILGRLRLAEGTRLELGDRTRVRGRVIVNGGGRVRVGPDTLLNGCWIVAATEVTLGAGCLVSDCGITDSDFHNLDPDRRHLPPDDATRRPVRIEDNVWVGAHALVLKGTEIGRDSVVGAGAVVRGNVPERVVVSGNPARIVKKFDDPEPLA